MKNSIIKAAVATAVGLITATSAAFAGPACHQTAMQKIERGTTDMAHLTWRDSKRVARTVVHSPVIAYQVVRGDRPLFPRETASRGQGHREQIALAGHRKAESKQQGPPI